MVVLYLDYKFNVDIVWILAMYLYNVINALMKLSIPFFFF